MSSPSGPPEHTREERLELAWRGRPQVDVEAHPVFSTMQHRVQELSDGSMIVHHLRCASWREPDRVNTFGGGNWATTTVQHGQEGSVCCDRQFVIREGLVAAYRQVPSMGGSCTAEAVFYPDGKRPPGLR